MIQENTVFIIGAGASKPYGYPTGIELRKMLCNDYKNIFSRLTNFNKSADSEKIRYFSDAFKNSLIPSIDQYLSLVRDDNIIQDMGKIGISYFILDSEFNSTYAEGMSNNKQDWLTYLYRLMTKSFKDPTDYKYFKDNNVSFIIFNYDRFIEFVLSNSFYYSFNTNNKKCFDITYDIFPFNFIHIYGKIAPLPYEITTEIKYDYKKIDYKDYLLLNSFKHNIRTIYESDRVDRDDILNAKKIISSAERVFFLGFGYADENLAVLDLPNILNPKQKIYGTAMNLTEREIIEIKNKFKQNYEFKRIIENYSNNPNNPNNINNPIIENYDCLALLRKYL